LELGRALPGLVMEIWVRYVGEGHNLGASLFPGWTEERDLRKGGWRRLGGHQAATCPFTQHWAYPFELASS
jgi:hypothetical protein